MYDEIYADSVKGQLISVFSRVPLFMKDIDIEWWVTLYMKSKWRQMVEDGHPYYICKYGLEVAYALIPDRKTYKKGNKDLDIERDEYTLYWMAIVYNYLCHNYHIRCRRLIELIPFRTLLNMFYPNHERSLKTFTDILYNEFLKDNIREIDLIAKETLIEQLSKKN